VFESFAGQPVAEADGPQQFDRRVFQNASADPRQDIVLGPGLDYHGLDGGSGQQVGQQQTGRTGPDNGYLDSHPDSEAGGSPSRQPSLSLSGRRFDCTTNTLRGDLTRVKSLSTAS